MEKNNTKKKNIQLFDNIFIGCIATLLILYVLVILVLVFWAFLTSLKSEVEYGWIQGGMVGLPTSEYSKEEILLNNYKLIIGNLQLKSVASFYTSFGLVNKEVYSNFWTLCVNTLLYAGVGAVILAGVPCLMAFMCSKYKNKVSSIIYNGVIIVMAMPIVGSYITDIQITRALGIYDSWIGNWIQKFNFTGMYFLVYFAFFEGLSNTYIEAAEIDGASQFKTMTSIIFPLTSKMFLSVALIQFVTLWNDYQTLMLYMPTHPTLALAVYNLQHAATSGMEFGANEDVKAAFQSDTVKMAGCITLALPIFIFFIVFRDTLMGNISMGGIKE